MPSAGRKASAADIFLLLSGPQHVPTTSQDAAILCRVRLTHRQSVLVEAAWGDRAEEVELSHAASTNSD